jgi:hypothetical protein
LSEAYSEELALILYFFTKNLSQAGTAGQEEGTRTVQTDLRFKTLMQLVYSKLQELEYDYVVSIVWSLGICVSAFGLELESEDKLRLLSTLNMHLDLDKVSPAQYASIPSLAFSISCFFTEQDMNELVTETVGKLSTLYGKNIMYSSLYSEHYD